MGALVLRHATSRAGSAPPPVPSGAVAAARDLLHGRLADPPTLSELADAVDSQPFGLLRAFRAAFGLPPHAYLNQARVRRARALLGTGQRPAEVAAAVGFSDQAHLARHFTRSVGVPPGAYARERRNVQDGRRPRA